MSTLLSVTLEFLKLLVLKGGVCFFMIFSFWVKNMIMIDFTDNISVGGESWKLFLHCQEVDKLRKVTSQPDSSPS